MRPAAGTELQPGLVGECSTKQIKARMPSATIAHKHRKCRPWPIPQYQGRPTVLSGCVNVVLVPCQPPLAENSSENMATGMCRAGVLKNHKTLKTTGTGFLSDLDMQKNKTQISTIFQKKPFMVTKETNTHLGLAFLIHSLNAQASSMPVEANSSPWPFSDTSSGPRFSGRIIDSKQLNPCTSA